MSYTYLGLVNDICKRVNETQLTSSNFASATGFYSDAKQAVNLTLTDINTRDFSWPFNLVVATQVLTPRITRYNYPADAKSIAYDTFRIRQDDTLGNDTIYLRQIDYEEFLQKYSGVEYDPEQWEELPSNVFRTRKLQFGLVNPPDKAYTLDYEYYKLPVALENHDDVPTVPEIFKHVVHNGTMYYAYMFRGDNEAAAISKQIYDKSADAMRSIYINRTPYLRSTKLTNRG